MQYLPITCAKALHHLHRMNPYSWDLNIYRGCEHGCKYCFALYSHDYLNNEGFFDQLYVKTNVVEQLEKELRSRSWKREVINLGGVTDSYQPAEAEHQLMPHILKLLIKYKTPAIISTKSDLILRDFDLIDQLSRITYINVAATIVTTDEALRAKLEPQASPIAARFAMLKEFRKTNASTGIHMMPVIPFLTDTEENISSLFAQAKEINIHYLIYGMLNLRGKTRPYFLNFIKTEYPQFLTPLYTLFQNKEALKQYSHTVYQRLNRLRQQYELNTNYMSLVKEKIYKEPDLFSGLDF